MKAHTLTTHEAMILQAIPFDEFYEGFDSLIWTNVLLQRFDISNRELRGVISSLIQKEYVWVGEGDEEFNYWSNTTIGLDEKGIEWLKNESGLTFNQYGDLI